MNAAKIVEQFKKFNFNQDSFNQIVLSNQKKNGKKSKKQIAKAESTGNQEESLERTKG